MKYVDKIYTHTYEVKQSKFISYLTPYTEFKNKLEILKDEHPKARHFVVAYRYLNEFKQIVEHSSDDGEPKGTSGKPSLMVIQGSQMINSAVIIVRYFGGTKLGTGGLVRAYSEAVNGVIKVAQLLEYKEEIYQTISFLYTNLRKVEYECQKNNIVILKKTFDLNLIYEIKASKEDLECFIGSVQRLIIYLP